MKTLIALIAAAMLVGCASPSGVASAQASWEDRDRAACARNMHCTWTGGNSGDEVASQTRRIGARNLPGRYND